MRMLNLLTPALLGLATPSVAYADEVECHRNDRFHVAVRENADYVGMQFAVTPAAKADDNGCTFDDRGGFRIGSADDPLWFAALMGDRLVLTRSTGPQGDLVVFDLTARAPVLEVPADDFSVDDAGVTYWERTAEGSAANCPDFGRYKADGLGAAIVTERRLDFAGNSPAPTGRTRCDPTQ